MKIGQGWSSWQTCLVAVIATLPIVVVSSGCVSPQGRKVVKNLMGPPKGENAAVESLYRVSCPDLVEIQVHSRPECSGRFEIKPDGRIELGDYGKLRIEGKTPREVAQTIAESIDSALEKIQVRVIEYRSQHVMLFGEVIGSQRSVSYRGPETVLELLRRSGGITRGAEPKDVYVLRPHLGENQRPEAFRVDLHAIVLEGDNKTNIRLLPFDHVYVGETRKAQIEKSIPPWMRGAFEAIWDARSPAKDADRRPSSDS